MTDKVLTRVREVLGPEAIGLDPAGGPRVAPTSTEGVARVLELAAAEGWRVRIEGRATWCPPDAPADLAVTTLALDGVTALSPGDLVATIAAGTPIGAVARRLAEDGAWLACDPPGLPERTLGSIVATATAGPSRNRFGPVRDQILGCTFVTGDGRIVRPGGAVVKNVAGYDLTKLAVGGFGAFGVLTELHVRLRAIPAAETTLTATGTRDGLTSAGRDLAAAGVDPVALELMSPAFARESAWVLAVRLVGTIEGIQAETDRIRSAASLAWVELTSAQAADFWQRAAVAALAGRVTIRLGVLVTGLDDTLDLLAEQLDLGLVAAGAGSGLLRWTGNPTGAQLEVLRHSTASREIPVTLERAPWPLRRSVGHFGRYREGVGRIIGRLRDTFDPERLFQVPLDGTPDA